MPEHKCTANFYLNLLYMNINDYFQNMFLAIINDTYSVVKVEIDNSKNDVVMGDYFKVYSYHL